MPIAGVAYRLTADNVDRTPDWQGVYTLIDRGETTYIGRADGDGVTIRSRLHSHVSGVEGPCTKAATHYKREVTSSPAERESELLDEYLSRYGRLPRCNAEGA